MKKLPLISILLLLCSFQAYGFDCFESTKLFLFPKRVLVHTQEDFERHTLLHIKRVVLMGETAYRMFPEQFPELNEKLVRDFLKLHDQGKVNRELTEGYPFRRPIIDRLYEFYGRRNFALTEKRLKERTALVAELNAVDDQVAMDFFVENKLLDPEGNPNQTAKQLLRLEKIVDFVDRGSSNVSPEEFARPTRPGSDWLKEARDSFIAKKLEDIYEILVEELRYRPDAA